MGHFKKGYKTSSFEEKFQNRNMEKLFHLTMIIQEPLRGRCRLKSFSKVYPAIESDVKFYANHSVLIMEMTSLR